jgi:hypothetical protein
MPDCNKSFYQKTHLEIHIRAHTGAKPFECKAPGCGQRFSQLGNLKVCNLDPRTYTVAHFTSRHMRGAILESAHTAATSAARPLRSVAMFVPTRLFTSRSSPSRADWTIVASSSLNSETSRYVIEIRIAQDVAKHTQSHQNKFHAATLRYLTQKFATITPGDYVSVADKELWEYFASLYKNSNKGIKGRGKDRRISAMSSSSAHHSQYTGMPNQSMHRSYPGSYQHNDSDRSSRSSSASTDNGHHRSEPAYDFNAPIQTGYPPQNTGYDDMVFPERKLY